MAKKIIRTGTTADPTGDSLKNAFIKVNDNFTELYNALGLDADLLNLGAFEFTGSVMTTTDSTAIVIDQAATITSNLSVGGDILPQTANGGDLGSSTLPWRSLYVSNNTIYIGGVAIGLDASNNLTVSGSRVGTTSYADLSGKPALTTVSTTGAYADLTGKPTIPTLVSQLANDSGFLTSVGNISNIQSEGDINIDINLADSTLRRWRFGEDGDLTLPSTSGFIDRLYTDNSGSRTKLEKKIESSPTTGTIAKLELDLDNGHIRLAIGNYTGGGDQWIDTSTWAFRGDTGSLTLPPAGKIINNNKEWTFGTTGTLTLPLGGVIAEGGGISGAIKLTPAGGANANQALLIYPTGTAEGDHIHLTAGGGSTELYLGDDLHFVKLTSDGFVVIKAYDGVNGAVWGFSPDGTTSIPGDIKSDSNINIEINLSDSTKRIWQFGEDGFLNVAGPIVLPNNGELRPSSTAYDAALATWELNIAQFVRDRISLELVTEAGWPMATWYPTGATAQGYIDFLFNARAVQNAGGTLIIYPAMSADFYQQMRAALIAIRDTYNLYSGGVSLSSAYGKSWNFSETGDLTIPGSIRSDTGLYIDVNLADSTLHRWQFGEDGALTLPSVGKINNGAYDWTFGSTGNTTFPTGLTLGAPRGVGTVNFTAAVDKEFQIETGTATSGKLWQFGTDGTTSIPGDIRSNSNINIEVNLSDSTLRRWQFGEDGELTVPGPINGLGNSKLDFTTYGANTAYLTTTDTDSTALFMGAATAELYAVTSIQIRTNTDGASKAWTFGDDGSLTLPGEITLPNGAVIRDTAGDAVAFGQDAGLTSQGTRAIAIGDQAGQTSQGTTAVAVGGGAGTDTQGNAAVAIGYGAGQFSQGVNAIAIGLTAGKTNQGNNSIILNATGATLNQTTANTFTVAPIRNISATDGVLQYNASTKEVSYSNSVTAETFNTDQITVVGNRIATTVTNANLELECNGTGGVVINTLAEATTASTARSAGYLGIPASTVSTTATLTIADAGEHIYVTTNSQTITIPANASVAYPIGTTLTFIAGPSATTVTIAITSDTLRLAGGTSTGSRTLAANGMATAVKVAATTWYINGTGLT